MRTVLAPLVGAAILVSFAIASLPRGVGLHRPRTPFDRSAAGSVAPAYALLREALAVIPKGASVVVRSEPPNADQETDFHRFAVSLLPGRRILPAAFYGGFVDPAIWRDAEFIVFVGAKPREPPGALLLETSEGSVWRRSRR